MKFFFFGCLAVEGVEGSSEGNESHIRLPFHQRGVRNKEQPAGGHTVTQHLGFILSKVTEVMGKRAKTVDCQRCV